MQNILTDLSNHAERFQEHVNTAKSSDTTQQDKEQAFFNAQIHWHGIQQKFQEISNHVSLEFVEVLRGLGFSWMKENVPLENSDAEKKIETAATPETHEYVQPVSQPQYLGDVQYEKKIDTTAPVPQQTQDQVVVRYLGQVQPLQETPVQTGQEAVQQTTP